MDKKRKHTVHTDINTPKKTHTPNETDPENVGSVDGHVKTKWACKSCGCTVILGVVVKHPPTHICRKKAGRIIPLQKEGEL